MRNLTPIKDIEITKIKSFSHLAKEMKLCGGYVAKKFGVAYEILTKMLKDKNCFKILSFPANLIATGTRGIIKTLVERKMFDVIITTCGTLDHDLARVWKDYYHGSFLLDDKKLHHYNINREGNILIPNACYGEILEEKMHPILNRIYHEGKKDLTPYEIVWEFGKSLENENKKESSIIYWAWKNKVPIFVPGITDGAFGSQLWLFWQKHKDFNINVLKEEQRLAELMFSTKKSGALMIGGGISKHHTIWWNQFKGGLDYAIYITTAPEWDGSLSGARLREAVSWGKVNEKAKFVTIQGDATIILPLLILSVLEEL